MTGANGLTGARPIGYLPSAESQRQGLPDIAGGIHAQLLELYARPCPAAAERLAANLAGASRAVLRYREAMLREGTGDGGQ